VRDLSPGCGVVLGVTVALGAFAALAFAALVFAWFVW